MASSKSWPADAVERRPVDLLVPYARNARTHSPAQVDQIAASIREWGWTVPVLVDEENGLIAGHGRVLAAKKLGLGEVPVMVARGWSEAQRRAYVLADNKLTLNAGWDEEILKIELGDLKQFDFDLELTGFSADEIAAFTADKTAGLTDPDEVPEPPAIPVSEPGDVWLLGPHRLVCGDSTNADDVDKSLNGVEIDLIFTSPPYAQQRIYGQGDGAGDWDALMRGVFSILPGKPGAQVLVNLGLVHKEGEWSPYWDGWIDFMRSAGWRSFGWYVWDQGPGLPGNWGGRLAPSHEFIFHFNRIASLPNKTKEKRPENIRLKSGTGLRRADGSMSGISSPAAGLQTHKIGDSVIRVMRAKGTSKLKHPAMFPAGLVKEIADSFAKEGNHLYEPFSGSGTTIIAAEMTSRVCHAIEISPAYVDVAVERWQAFTGKQATLEATGQTFAEMKASRVGQGEIQARLRQAG